MKSLLLWSVLALFLSLQEEVSIVDTTIVPELKPQAIEHTDKNDKVAPEVAVRYGTLFQPKPSYGLSPRVDDSAKYQHWYPYPEMRYIPIKPVNFLQHEPGIKRVEAFRQHWHKVENGYNVTEDEVWHWEPPKELQDSWVVSTSHSPGDHFMALVLRPAGAKLRNPVVCYFDAEKGFVWQKEMPLITAYAAVKEKVVIPPAELESKFPDVNAEGAVISKDGSRIVVIMPFQQPCLSLMFVYDNEGNLLKTAASLQRFFTHDMSFSRTPRGNRLILRFNHRYDTEDETGKKVSHRDDEDYLADFNGNLLCRFNEPLNGSQYSPVVVSDGDEYASILDFQNHEQHIYALPK